MQKKPITYFKFVLSFILVFFPYFFISSYQRFQKKNKVKVLHTHQEHIGSPTATTSSIIDLHAPHFVRLAGEHLSGRVVGLASGTLQVGFLG